MVDHTCHHCSKASYPVLERTVSFPPPLALSPVWSLVWVKFSSTFSPVDGVGDLTVLLEVMAKDGSFLLPLTVFIMMLPSYVRVQYLSAGSIRNYVLVLNSKLPGFISFCYCGELQQRATKTSFCPLSSQMIENSCFDH